MPLPQPSAFTRLALPAPCSSRGGRPQGTSVLLIATFATMAAIGTAVVVVRRRSGGKSVTEIEGLAPSTNSIDADDVLE